MEDSNKHHPVNERGASYREYQSRYYAKNKEKLSTYHKEWYQNNKERVDSRRNERVRCECGVGVRYCYMGKHRKSSRHIERMKIIDQYD